MTRERESESETAWCGSRKEGREERRPLWAQAEDRTLSLTHTCESSCCCGERDEGEADMAAITGGKGARGQLHRRKA